MELQEFTNQLRAFKDSRLASRESRAVGPQASPPKLKWLWWSKPFWSIPFWGRGKANVYLPSGDGCSVEVSSATPISELKATAQKHFKRREAHCQRPAARVDSHSDRGQACEMGTWLANWLLPVGRSLGTWEIRNTVGTAAKSQSSSGMSTVSKQPAVRLLPFLNLGPSRMRRRLQPGWLK